MSDLEKIRSFWIQPGSLATPLLVLFLDSYGPEAMEWDPETVVSELEDDFKIRIPSINIDKLMTAILVVTTDRFFRSLPDFITVCNVLSGSSFDPREFDPADAAECDWGMTEALMLEPPEHDSEEFFSKEILAYIGKVVEDEGLINPPDLLRIGSHREGHRDPGADFSDDPEMYHAIREMEQSKSDGLKNAVRQRLDLLVRQLHNLPLKTGNSKEVVGKILKHLPGGKR